MKITPNFKVVGEVAYREKVINAIDNLYTNPWPLPDVDKFDCPKTAEQSSILKFVNEETNTLMRDAGVEPFDIPESRYLRIKKENFTRYFGKESSGVNDGTSPRIGLLYEDTMSNIAYAKTSLHETLHVKAMHMWEVYEDGGKTPIKLVRHGIIINSSHKLDMQNKKYSYFASLHEATVEWQNELLFEKVLNLPEMAIEKEHINSQSYKDARQKLAKDLNVTEDRILFIDNGEPVMFAYSSPRRLLKYVCDEISKKFSDKYPTKEHAFKEFVKVNFTSDLSTVTKLVDEVFGEKSFTLFEKLVLEDGTRASCEFVHSELEKRLQIMLKNSL